jgi:Holliday junction resolvase RusA-like endonuclease
MTAKLNNSDDTTELQALVQIIFGEPASKSNSRRVVRFGGMSRLIKSEKALDYCDVFKQQCRQLGTLMTGDLRVTLRIYYASRRPDLDETLILDLMQGLIYENDRQVKERHAYWGLDPENPRAEITIERIPEVAPKKKPQRKAGAKGEATARLE